MEKVISQREKQNNRAKNMVAHSLSTGKYIPYVVFLIEGCCHVDLNEKYYHIEFYKRYPNNKQFLNEMHSGYFKIGK